MQHWIAWYTGMDDEEGIGDTYFGPFFTQDEAEDFIETYSPEMFGKWDHAETFCVNSPNMITQESTGQDD